MKIGNIQVGVPYYIKNLKTDGQHDIENGLLLVHFVRTDFKPDALYKCVGYAVSFDPYFVNIITPDDGSTIESFSKEFSKQYPDCMFSLSKFNPGDPDPDSIFEPEMIDACKAVYARVIGSKENK